MTDLRLYERIAGLLEYPGDGCAERWLEAVAVSRPEHPQLASDLEQFIEKTSRMSLDDLEELYTRTFDLDPAATLEIGWHLFGESYDRGRFLATMRESLHRAGVPEDGELPDHLASVLRFIPVLRQDQRDWWVHQYPLQAIDRIIKSLERGESPYLHLLSGTAKWLRSVHPFDPSMDLVEFVPVHGELNPDHFDETGTPVGRGGHESPVLCPGASSCQEAVR